MPQQLTTSQLFQPAPSGVGPYSVVGGRVVAGVPRIPPPGSWLASLEYIAGAVQLPTTAFQPNGPELSILATESVCFALSDAAVSQMAQGGFLLPAATGTVTYTAPDGTQVTIPVTADPSNPAQNPTGAPGYLDLLAANVYDVTRLPATYVTGPLAIVKLSAGTLTYAAGAYHVGNAASGATYHNESALSIPASTSTGVTAVTTGSSTTVTTSLPHGLSAGQSVYVLIPSSSGVSGLFGVFALVTAVVSPTMVTLSAGSSGTYTGPAGALWTCTLAEMVADVAGPASNAAPGAAVVAITQNAGTFVGNVVPWAGANYESNPALANRCVLSLASRSPNGPSQAYVYFALSASQILAAASPPILLDAGPIVDAVAFSTPMTGVVSAVVASASPASIALDAPITPGVAQLPIASITNGNPTIIMCAGPTGLQVGESFTATISDTTVMVDSDVVDSIVDGTFLGSYVSANAFSIPLDTTTAPSSYVALGTVDGGDLGQVDRLLQENVVPENTSAIAVSALALPIAVAATIVVPMAKVAAYTAAALAALQTQLASYLIGGGDLFQVSWDDIEGALSIAGVPSPGAASYARVQSLTLNGQGPQPSQPGNGGIAFRSPFSKAVLATPALQVLGT